MQVRKDSWRVACAAVVLGMSFAGAASAQQFRLIAGGEDGDGGPALQANLAGAVDAVYDSAGNLYVSQSTGNRIRKITPAGTITTLVGGNAGFGGDGGPASAAKINRPLGLEIDAAGNLYFADSGNRRIRRISTTGIITTVAGNGQKTFAGDGGAATAASFVSVYGLALDASGNLFVTDPANARIRKIATNGVITTIAGKGYPGSEGDGGPAINATFYSPVGIDFDAAGNLLIADSFISSIRKITPAGIISTFPGWVDSPLNIAVGPDGAIYVASHSCTLVRWNNASGAFDRIAGAAGYKICNNTAEGEYANATPIGAVEGIAFDPQGRVVFVDIDVDRVRRVSDKTIDALVTTIAGAGGNFANGRAAIGAPMGTLQSISMDSAGNLLLADSGYRRVRRITPGGTIDTLGGTGFGGGCANGTTSCPASTYGFAMPWGIAPGNVAGQVLVSDPYNKAINAIGSNGALTLYVGALTGSTVHYDWGPRLDVYVWPKGLTRKANGDYLVASANTLSRLSGDYIGLFAGWGGSESTGDGGPAYNAATWGPLASAIDAGGTIYFSEESSMRVRKINTDGTIWRYAGNGTPFNSGDGGQAYDAGIGEVTALATYATDVYLAAADGVLRRIDGKGIITTVPFSQQAAGLWVDRDTLYVSTQEGRVYAASLTPRKVEHDYDGDGRSDILWRNTSTGANTIWKAANGATLQAVTGVTAQSWKIQGQGDFDGDGRDDIFWRNAQTGANTVWRSGNGAALLTTTGVTNVAWAVVGVGDFNKDGKSDLVWRNKANGENAIWTTLAGAGITVTRVPDQNWQIVGVGDFDGDFVADLLWRNAVTGANQVWRGGNAMTQLALAAAPAAWKVQGVGDFDGDGRSDIFWRNASTGQDVVWNGANAGSSRTLTTITDLKWNVAAVGDYNGDGKDDLLWRHGTTGANTIWKSANGATVQTVTGVTSTTWTIVPYANQP